MKLYIVKKSGELVEVIDDLEDYNLLHNLTGVAIADSLYRAIQSDPELADEYQKAVEEG